MIFEPSTSKSTLCSYSESDEAGELNKLPITTPAKIGFIISVDMIFEKIFDVLRSMPVGKNNEIQLADAINVQAKKGLVQYVELDGNRFDCGSVEGYMKAIEYKYKRLDK